MRKPYGGVDTFDVHKVSGVVKEIAVIAVLGVDLLLPSMSGSGFASACRAFTL